MDFGSNCIMRSLTFLNPNIIRSIRERKIGWVGHKPYMRDIINIDTQCRFANISRKDHLVDLDRDAMLPSKMGFKRTAYVAVE
jgi:hypothetical protein